MIERVVSERPRYHPDLTFFRIDQVRLESQVTVYPCSSECKPFPAKVLAIEETPQEGNKRAIVRRSDIKKTVILGGGTAVRVK